jgi:hypothetical protein
MLAQKRLYMSDTPTQLFPALAIARGTLYRQTAVSDVDIALLFIATKRTIAIFRAIGQLGVFH